MEEGHSITLFRHTTPGLPGAPTVHILDKRHGFMLVAPDACRAALAEVLAEQVTVERDALVGRDEAELVNRGYCRRCIGTIAQATVRN